MSHERTVEVVFLVKQAGRRKGGRLELWCLHRIEGLYEMQLFQDLENKAEGRAAWTIIMKEALLNCKDRMPMKIRRMPS